MTFHLQIAFELELLRQRHDKLGLGTAVREEETVKMWAHHRDVRIAIYPEGVFDVPSVLLRRMSHTPKVTNFFPFPKSSTLLIFLCT
jgi:hypothetical protein